MKPRHITFMLFQDCTDWCKAHGKTIGQLDVRKRHHVSILAIKQNGHFAMTVITPETCLPANSTMLVLGTNQNVQKCFHI